MWRRGREVFIHVRVLLTTRRHTPPLGDGHPGGHLRAMGRWAPGESVVKGAEVTGTLEESQVGHRYFSTV